MFFKKAELGAEFIHGDLPVTLGLLKEADITLQPAGGEFWHYKDGRFLREGIFTEGWELFSDRLGKVKADLPVNEFLEKEFPGDEHHELKQSVRMFAAGYDTADPAIASTFALRDEWLRDDEERQHRPKNGYGQMISYLENRVKEHGGNIKLNSVVKQVKWQQGSVSVVTADGYDYNGNAVLIALPLGVLKAEQDAVAAVVFEPEISRQMEAVCDMGYGAIIKILLEFDEAFWEDEQTAKIAGASLKHMGFVISDEQVPTWWTQVPVHSPVLTGWLGGPPAAAKKDLSDEELLLLSLQSLSNIFKQAVDTLKDRLISFHVLNWTKDPFTLGSYAYDTVKTHEARKVMSAPVDDTIYFAGEYLYEGPVMGTVEAALISGKATAAMILNR
jgi:monoamine oxidase